VALIKNIRHESVQANTNLQTLT